MSRKKLRKYADPGRSGEFGESSPKCSVNALNIFKDFKQSYNEQLNNEHNVWFQAPKVAAQGL